MIRGDKGGWWAHALLTLGILTVVTTVYGVGKHFTPVPLGDQWDGGIGFYMRALQDPVGAFFEQHNEHRLTFSRLLFYADIRWFGGRNVLLLAANLVLAGLIALTLVRVTLHRAILSRSHRIALAGTALVFAFSWMQNENFTWGFQSQWFAVYLFALCAFHALDRSAEATARNDSARSVNWLLVAIGSSIVAAGSMSSGVLVFAVLLVQAFYLRIRWSRIAMVLIVALAVWIAYFATWHAPASSGSLSSALRHHPLGLLQYVTLYLGSLAQHGSGRWTGAFLCGAIVLGTLVVQGFRMLFTPRADAKASALFAVAVFVAGNAFVTACGRLWLGLGTALASRYTTASLLCWLALALFLLLNARTLLVQRAIVAAILVSVVLVASYQPTVFMSDRDETYNRDVAGLALRAHVYSPQLTQPVYPFPARLVAIAKDAEATRISIFAPGQRDYFVAPNRIAATSQCSGNIDSVSATETPGVYTATGWIYDPATHTVPRSIVVADATGYTLGTGIAGGERDDVRKIFGRHARFSRWTAFFKSTPATVIHVNGSLAKGFCQIADSKTVPVATP